MSLKDLTPDAIGLAALVFLALLGAYITIMSAVKAWREERRHQAAPVTDLSARVAQQDEKLAMDKRRLDAHEAQLIAMDEQQRIMLRGIMAMLSHELNGNSVDKLRESMDEIQSWLIKK